MRSDARTRPIPARSWGQSASGLVTLGAGTGTTSDSLGLLHVGGSASGGGLQGWTASHVRLSRSMDPSIPSILEKKIHSYVNRSFNLVTRGNGEDYINSIIAHGCIHHQHLGRRTFKCCWLKQLRMINKQKVQQFQHTRKQKRYIHIGLADYQSRLHVFICTGILLS